MIDYVKIAMATMLISLSTSCICLIKVKDFDSFPPIPKYKEYSDLEKPVLSFDADSQTYVVSSKMVENALYNNKYIEEITKWKKRNGVE